MIAGLEFLPIMDYVTVNNISPELIISHAERIHRLRQLVLSGQARNASKAMSAEKVNIELVRSQRLQE